MSIIEDGANRLTASKEKAKTLLVELKKQTE